VTVATYRHFIVGECDAQIAAGTSRDARRTVDAADGILERRSDEVVGLLARETGRTRFDSVPETMPVSEERLAG
jgi:hypothetical protein